MANLKISQLPVLTGADSATDDEFVVVDTSATETKRITRTELIEAVTQNFLAAYADTIAATAVDVFVYDTSKDSDGGAWRERTQGTSWYSETLNTSTRGATRKFPAVAVIVAEASKITIYDADDPALPMWMVFETSGSSYNSKFLPRSAVILKAVAMANGFLAVGGNAGSPYHDAFVEISFLKDEALFRSVSLVGKFHGGISARNSTSASEITGSYIVSSTINDIAMTVLPGAPIDSATGLPVPTIAVATDGGVSVINNDGTVADSAYTSAIGGGQFDAEGNLYFWRNTFGGRMEYSTVADYEAGDGFGDQIGNTSATSDIDFLSYSAALSAHSLNGGILVMGGADTSGTAVPGLSYYHLNPSDFTKGMSALITSDYNTGWMVGDTKGAWMSDTDTTNITGADGRRDNV